MKTTFLHSCFELLLFNHILIGSYLLNELQVVMKRAQNVAQAVVRTRSSLSSWSCMGARRRTVGPLPNSKEESSQESDLIIERTAESLVTEVIVTRDPLLDKVEYGSSSDGSGHDDTDEEERLISVDRAINTSTAEDMTEGELWYELERELQREAREADVLAKEEAAAAIEITEEEIMLADAVVESKTPISSSDVSENQHFYPPGKIMHMVSIPTSDGDNSGHDGPYEEHVRIYETPRELYSKLRLTKTMINDHYMPMYKKMMELLIRELENEEPVIV